MADDAHIHGTQSTRSLPIRGSVERIMQTWEARREEILDGIPAASGSLRPGIDQGRWGTTFRLTLAFDALPTRDTPGTLASKALRRLKSLVEAGVGTTAAKRPAPRVGPR